MNTYKNISPGGGDVCRRASAPIAARSLNAEAASEFLIPDYMPELRRMISASARVLPTAHYLAPGRAEFAGSVRFRVLYEGSDGAVWSAELPSEYETALPIEDASSADGEVSAYADAICEAVTVRVVAPRKLSLRARLRVDAVAVGHRSTDVTITGASALPTDDIKQLERTAQNAVILRGRTEPAEYSDSFLPDDGGAGELRALGCNAEVFVGEVGACLEGVAVRGEIIASVMLCRDTEGARPFAVTRRIPFRETVPLDRIPDQSFGCRAWGCVESAAIEPDENGLVACTFGLVLSAEALASETVTYTADVYSMSCRSEVQTVEFDMPRAQRCFNANISLGGGEELSVLGLDSGMRVIDAHAEAISLSCTEKDGGFAPAGKLRVRVWLDDGAQTVAKDMELQFKYEPDGATASELRCAGGYSELIAGAPVCRARIDGERLVADCELTLAVRLCDRERIRAVRLAELGEARDERDGGITIFYPSARDSLWSVAKRYGVDAGELALANAVGAADIATAPTDARFLVIDTQKR